MIDPEQLRPLREAADDFKETERLKKVFRELRAQRVPFYLRSAELDEIFHWKLQGQYGRDAAQLNKNTETAYKTITCAAFDIREPDAEYEAKLRIGVLTSLHGVGIPVASAILALIDPDNYCVVDFRGWRAVFCEDRRSFGIKDYLRYLHKVKGFSAVLGWSPQEVDLALWELDRRQTASN